MNTNLYCQIDLLSPVTVTAPRILHVPSISNRTAAQHALATGGAKNIQESLAKLRIHQTVYEGVTSAGEKYEKYAYGVELLLSALIEVVEAFYQTDNDIWRPTRNKYADNHKEQLSHFKILEHRVGTRSSETWHAFLAHAPGVCTNEAKDLVIGHGYQGERNQETDYYENRDGVRQTVCISLGVQGTSSFPFLEIEFGPSEKRRNSAQY